MDLSAEFSRDRLEISKNQAQEKDTCLRYPRAMCHYHYHASQALGLLVLIWVEIVKFRHKRNYSCELELLPPISCSHPIPPALPSDSQGGLSLPLPSPSMCQGGHWVRPSSLSRNTRWWCLPGGGVFYLSGSGTTRFFVLTD